MDISFDLVALLKQQPTKTHKVKPSQFVSVAGGVQKRLEINIQNRKNSRLSSFDRIRNIPKESPRPPPLSEVQLKAERRKQQLEKWKEEKEKKKNAAAAQKKKPFVAGVSHRNTFGPPPPPRPMPSTSGRVTRSQASKQRSEQANQPQSFAPTNAAFKPPQFKNPKVSTLALVRIKKTDNKSKPAMTFEPVLPKTTQNSRATRSKTVLNKPNFQTKKPDSKVTLKPKENTKGNPKNPSPKITISVASSIESAKSSDSEMTSSSVSLEMSTPTKKQDIPRSESSSEEKLRSPRSPVHRTPEQIIEEAMHCISTSPFVTMSRGKANARREMKKKRDEGLLDEDNSNMDSVNHFRRILDSEISRITGICEAWDKIFAQTKLPEPIQELVLTAVGQARLLASQKMQQFAGLLGRCARPAPGAALVTPADLAGFWDMLYMQVENVDMRFKNLEELRARGWAEEAPPAPAPARRPRARRPAGRRPPLGAGPSQLRDMIAAARKAKKEQESQSSNQSESEKSESTPLESKTFEAGFFSVSSPLKKPAASALAATPANKSSLLKSVLSSEARKASASKTSASFAMLRASLMSKNVDIEGVSPLMQTPTVTPVNLFATPARSILKQSNSASSKKPEKLKMVLFDVETSSPVSYTSCGNEEELRPPEVKEVEVEEKEKENKPAPRRRSRLSRQNPEDRSSPVMTRSRRKSAQTPLLPADTGAGTGTAHTRARARDSGARAGRAADAQETPRRASTRRKSAAVV